MKNSIVIIITVIAFYLTINAQDKDPNPLFFL